MDFDINPVHPFSPLPILSFNSAPLIDARLWEPKDMGPAGKSSQCSDRCGSAGWSIIP